MFGRTAKTGDGQAPERRRVQRGAVPPAFSYYNTSRVPEPAAEDRPPVRRTRQDAPEQQPAKTARAVRPWLARVPFWLFLAVLAVCTIKILILSNNPKVVVVGGSGVAGSYMQPASVYAAAAQKLLTDSVANRSKLTVDASAVSGALQREFPELMDVSMTIPLVSNRPVLYVQPATPSLVLRGLSGDYALNGDGVVLAQVHALPAGVPVAVDQSGLNVRPGKQVISGDTISFMKSVAYQFLAAHLVLSNFVLPSGTPYELDARLEGKPYTIRFNLEEDARIQSGAAIATVGQLGDKTPANYIDVRVPGRVYYK